MKILVGYDGSGCANAALDDLRRAGVPDDAQIVVLSVVENWLPPPSSLEIIEHIDRDQEYQSLAQHGAMQLIAMQPSWDVKSELGVGSPATVIIESADQCRADLIVVGSHGRTALGRFFFGSVSQKVLHEAHHSVRVARGRVEEPDTSIRLIIGVDGSKGAELAVESVAARNWPAGSEARIINARWPFPQLSHKHGVGPLIEWVTEVNARVGEMVDKAITRLRAAGLNTTAIIKEDDPKRLLVNEAEKWGADCIFLGARGAGRIERFLIGSVSSAVAARAHCSVEIVRERIGNEGTIEAGE
jgi:nucleotide-binding universal stress UspA family protein